MRSASNSASEQPATPKKKSRPANFEISVKKRALFPMHFDIFSGENSHAFNKRCEANPRGCNTGQGRRGRQEKIHFVFALNSPFTRTACLRTLGKRS